MSYIQYIVVLYCFRLVSSILYFVKIQFFLSRTAQESASNTRKDMSVPVDLSCILQITVKFAAQLSLPTARQPPFFLQ